MTLLVTLLLLAAPTTMALGTLAFADPKRRRTRGRAPASDGRRAAAASLLALCGGLALAGSGTAGLLVWGFAVTAGGWAMSNGLAMLPDAVPAAVGRIAAGMTGRRRGDGSPSPRPRSVAGALRARMSGVGARRGARRIAAAMLALGGLLMLNATRQATSAGASATQRLVTVALLDRLDRGEAARRAASPCLMAFAADRGEGLRDLLSDRDAALLLPRVGTLGGSLQRCILAQGGEGAAVTREGDDDRFEIDGATVARIHAAVTGVLLDADALADLSAGNGLLCRRTATAIGPELDEFLDALGKDRRYAKVDDVLLRLPALDRQARERRAGIPCPA